ncbi:unnamed protein product [Mortierella alpina]
MNLPLELWQHVYQYLSQSDLLQGALVSPTLPLSLYCQSRIWARIDAEDWVFENFHQGLARNSRLVRRVACSSKARLEILSRPECCFITHLDVEKMPFLSSTVLESILEHNHQQLRSLRVRLDRTNFQMVTDKVRRMDLQSLCMQGCFGIRLSPAFITNLAELCPRLERVNFANQSTADGFYAALFRAIPGLREIKATGSILTDGEIQTLLQHCSSTLESLDIGYCTSLDSRSVLSILTGCPSLVYLDARGVDFNPRDMEAADAWVCTKLTSLYLEILLPKRAHYVPGEPEAIRKRLYQQLARLTRLQSLQLGAGSRDRGINILEMSLLTGLSSLSSLTQLRRLEIKRLNHAVRGAEVAWMLEHWPKLQTLGILLDTNADMELVRAVHQRCSTIHVW